MTGSGTAPPACPRTTDGAWCRCRAAAPTPTWSASSTSSTKAFVAGGFRSRGEGPAGLEGQRHVYVGTDFGPGSMTTSGYPRIVKEWQRGTPLAERQTVYEGQATDVAVYGMSIDGHRRSRATSSSRRLAFFHQRGCSSARDGKLDAARQARSTPRHVHRE